MGARPEILLINLDRSPDRLAFMTSQLERLGLPFTRLPGIDGATISDAEFERLADTYMRPMSRSELGCLKSHERAWQASVDQDKPILVLEDDGFLSDRLPAFLADYAELDLDAVVNLETRGKKKWVSNKPMASGPASGVSLLEMYVDRGGAAGYVVSPSVARALLELAQTYAAPADAFINLSGVHLIQVEPGLVSEVFRGSDRELKLKPGFISTMRAPGKTSVLSRAANWPKYKFRRFAGYLAASMRKVSVIGVGSKREIAICPSILERAGNRSV